MPENAAPLVEEIPGEKEIQKSHTRVEAVVVVVLLLGMVVLPTVQTVARRFGVDLAEFAVLTRHLTLWIGFLGGLLATGANKHIALATTEALKPGRFRTGARVFAQMASTATCALMAWAAIQFAWNNRTLTETIVGHVPVIYSQAVMPVALALMALRFAWKSEGGWLGRALCLAAAVAAFGLGLMAAPGALLLPLVILVLVSFLLGAPVFVAMSALAMIFFFKENGAPAGDAIAGVPVAIYELVTKPTLAAIPLLTLAGYILAEGGAARRLIRAYRALFGWMPGGLAVMAAFVCALFTTFTGASGVTILALGGLIYPSLVAEGYPEGFSLGLVTAAGSLGLLFPPSIPVNLYSVVSGTPVDKLFIGGLVPGTLMIVLVAAYGIVVGVRAKAPRQAFDVKEAVRATWAAKWDFGLPVLVIVAFGSGFATVVEASALAAAYALVVELAIFRDVHPFEHMPRVFVDAATLVGAVLILLGVALGLTDYLVIAEVPTQLVAWVTAHIHSPALFLLSLNVILLVLGSVLEIYSAIVVLAPLVAPLGVAYGIDPVHLGVVFLANLELGFLFPPMGLNLFLSASRFQKPLPVLYRKAFPFLVIMTVGVLAITYFSPITTGVVHLFGK